LTIETPRHNQGTKNVQREHRLVPLPHFLQAAPDLVQHGQPQRLPAGQKPQAAAVYGVPAFNDVRFKLKIANCK
jgi:hypothetical protein